MRCSEYHVSGLALTLLRRRLKNKFAHPTPLGYRDVNSNIGLQLGDDRGKHLAEVQLSKSVVAAKDIAHDQYDVIREALPKMCEGTSVNPYYAPGVHHGSVAIFGVGCGCDLA